MMIGYVWGRYGVGMGMEKVWIYGYRVGKGMEKGDGMGMEMGRWGK